MLKRNLQRNQSVLVICSHSTINFMHLLNRIFPWSCFPGGIDLLLVNTSQEWLLIMLWKKVHSGSNIQLDKEKKTHLNALKALFCKKKMQQTVLKMGKIQSGGGPIWGGSARGGYLFQASGILKGRDFTSSSIRTVTAVCMWKELEVLTAVFFGCAKNEKNS